VFVDGTGRRRRVLRRGGYLIGGLCGLFMVLLLSSVVGGPRLPSSVLPLPHPAGHAARRAHQGTPRDDERQAGTAPNQGGASPLPGGQATSAAGSGAISTSPAATTTPPATTRTSPAAASGPTQPVPKPVRTHGGEPTTPPGQLRQHHSGT
jgi:hypothetical protein